MKLIVFVVINFALVIEGAMAAPDLTPFKDELTIPSTLAPTLVVGHTRVYQITMKNGSRKVHSELPAPTPFWGYEGQYPGPTIDVPRDEEVVVDFVNSLDAPAPPADPRTQWPFEIPPDDAMGVPYFVPAKPWTIVHLHGSPTRPDYDGWADNAYFPGEGARHFYPQQERAALLWYHDHGNMVTRLNVYAGLAGLYIVRDPATDVGRPAGDHELPLLLQDREFELTPDGMAFTGRFRYQPLNRNDKFETNLAKFLVNGTVRPYKKVDRGKYRLRILNGANSRFFRLAFVPDGGTPNTKTWEVIGVDGGPLKTPVSNPTTTTWTATGPGAKREMVELGPAERLDVVVDFSSYPENSNVELVNLKPNGTVQGKIMQFRVGAATPPPVMAEPRHTVARSPRLGKAYSPADDKKVVTIAAAPTAGAAAAPVGKRTIGLYKKGGMQTINGRMFQDAVEEKPEFESEEIWEFLNVSADDHPMHLHLVNFEVIDRQKIEIDTAVLPDLEQFDGKFRAWLADTSPSKPPLPPGVRFPVGSTAAPADAYEKEPKDTVRVPTNSLTRIKVKFRIHTGLYMFHCHILEHEDMEMMRPLLVAPAGMPAMAHSAGHEAGDHASSHAATPGHE